MAACKYIFILQLQEDSTKNYVGILDQKYQFTSFSANVKSQWLTKSVMDALKKKLLQLDIDSDTQIVMTSTVSCSSPLFLFLSLARKFLGFKFNTVALEKAFKRITAYHTSYAIGREYTTRDYNKLYKKLLAHADCAWISEDIDRQLQNLPRAQYRIQKILRICMYYMCIKHYFLSRGKK